MNNKDLDYDVGIPDPALTQAEDMRMVVAFTFMNHAAPVHLPDVLARLERELALAMGRQARVKVVAYAHSAGASVDSSNGAMTVVELLQAYQALDRGAGG